MTEHDIRNVLDTNEYEDLIAPKQLQNPSLWSKAKVLLSKFIRGTEEHPRFSRVTPIKYKDEQGNDMISAHYLNGGDTKTYIDKNGRCIVEHRASEHFEHNQNGIESSNSECIREIYDGLGKSGVPKIEKVSWSQKEMPDGTFERVENRVLFDSMADYQKHLGLIESYKNIMGEDVAIPHDIMNAHVKARANIRYNENGYDMKLDDFTTRTYHPGDTNLQFNAHTTSHIVKTKDGYTKDVTYRGPENYNRVLGTSREQSQIHAIDDKNNLTEHSYSFENKFMQIKKYSIDTPQLVPANSGISKMKGEYFEVDGQVREATGSQALSIDKNNSPMVTREYSSVQKMLEEFKSKHEAQETAINPQTCKLEISNDGNDAVFAMPDEHGYGDSRANMGNLKEIFSDVSESVGLNPNCQIYTAGLKSVDGIGYSRSSRQRLDYFKTESLKHYGYSKNSTPNKSVEDLKIDNPKNREALDER